LPRSDYALRRAQSARWSPSGARLSIEFIEGNAPNECGRSTTLIVEPISGTTQQIPSPSRALGIREWLDDDHILDQERVQGHIQYYSRNIQTGALTRLALAEGFAFRPVPRTAMSAPYIGTSREPRRGSSIFLVRKDLSRGRTLVYRENAIAGFAAIDPLGEWLAWTEAGSRPRLIIALRNLRAPAEQPPTFLGEEYEQSQFCDWTEDGRMLVLLKENGKYTLAIWDHRRGSVNRIPTAYEPCGHGHGHSWRKYGH
jgi:hypothetical protein